MTWRISVLIYAIMGAISIGVSWIFLGRSVWRYPGRTDPDWFAGACLGVLLGTTTHLLSYAYAATPQGKPMISEARHYLLAHEILFLSVVCAFGQRLFFTGLLLPLLGIPLSALLFTLCVRNNRLIWLAIPFLHAVAGGHLFRWSGDLTGVVIAEALANVFALRMTALAKQPLFERNVRTARIGFTGTFENASLAGLCVLGLGASRHPAILFALVPVCIALAVWRKRIGRRSSV